MSEYNFFHCNYAFNHEFKEDSDKFISIVNEIEQGSYLIDYSNKITIIRDNRTIIILDRGWGRKIVIIIDENILYFLELGSIFSFAIRERLEMIRNFEKVNNVISSFGVILCQ